MRKFFKVIIIFFLPILIIAISSEIALRSIPNDYLYKKEYLDQHAEELEILFLGSSHAFNGIDPSLIDESTFNAASNGQTLDYDFKIIEKYEKNFLNLQYVVVPVSYFSLFWSLEDGKKDTLKNYLLYYEFKTPFRIKNYSEVLSNSFSVTAKKLYERYVTKESTIKCDSLGALLFDDIVDISFLEKHSIREATAHKKDVETLSRGINIIEDIIDLVGENRTIIFYTPPGHEVFVKRLDLIQLNLTISTLESLAAQYNNVYYFNYISNIEFTTEDFKDSDHLNKYGATKLTQLIYDEIKKIENDKSSVY